MLRRFSTIFTLSFLLVAFMAVTAFGAKSAVSKRSKGKKTSQTVYYSYPDENYREDGGNTIDIGKSSYSSKAATLSPGSVIGDTWYDYQHNSSMGRMIDWGNDPSTGNAYIHFSWMKLPTAVINDRHYAYTHYNATTGDLAPILNLQNPEDFAGYVNVPSKNSGAAVYGGHNKPNGITTYQDHFYYNFAPGNPFWFESRVPDNVASYGSPLTAQSTIWPKFAYQETATDTVIHVLSQVSDEDEASGLYYFRKVGGNDNGTWDFPPYVVDTQNVLGHVITASKTSEKVALGWLGRVPADGDCDTCSNNEAIGLLWKQTENDVYYQISNDLGITFEPRVNATKYHYETGVTGWRANSEMSILIDAADEVHVVWTGVIWGDSFENLRLDKAARIFHTSESILAGGHAPRIAANSDWEQEDTIKCTSGKFEANVSKVQVSECDGKIYVLFVQYNDFPNGIYDDCAHRVFVDPSEYESSANGDLYVVVSGDGGVTWDIPRNLTNSRTPDCEHGVSGDCESDAWPSMTRYGRANNATETWAGAVIVDPSNTFTGAAGEYFLDVVYQSDIDPGGYAAGVGPEGTQQNNNMQWFRLACVEPVSSAQIALSPTKIQLPTWVKPNQTLSLNLEITNSGNFGLTYATSIEEDNGTPGWLSVSGLGGSVPSGLSNVENGFLNLNDGGVQTTEATLNGRVVFTSNAPNTVNLEVTLLVADTVVAAKIDTVVGYLSLSVGSDGKYGHFEPRVGLDYKANGVDCDTTLFGSSSYLGEGSPIILSITGLDTNIVASAFDNSWIDPDGFKPMAAGKTEPGAGSEATFSWYASGTFITPDSTVAFEQITYAPTAVGANYMIKELRIWSHDGAAHAGLRIGDVIDWDIPSDSGSDNLSGIDGLASRNLIYQVGTEFDQTDTLDDGFVDPFGTDCVDGDRRFGGMAFLKSQSHNGTAWVDVSDVPYSAYTARNDSFVYPAGRLVGGKTWANMENTGMSVETEITDQHMVMCYEPSLPLGATDTVRYFVSFITVQDGVQSDLADGADAAEAFAIANDYWPSYINSGSCCIGDRGNVDNDPGDQVDISDLVFIVDFIFTGGAAPECDLEANVDGDPGENIDISDLVYIVDFIFTGGNPPPACP